MFEYADHHAGATLFFRAATFNADFHANLLMTMFGVDELNVYLPEPGFICSALGLCVAADCCKLTCR
jgi:hypothetical protein